MKQYATSAPVSVVLDIPAGHIRRVAAERTEVGYGDGVLRVEAAAAKNRLLGPSGSLDVTIRCPPAPASRRRRPAPSSAAPASPSTPPPSTATSRPAACKAPDAPPERSTPMTSPRARRPGPATPAGPGPLASFLRFTLFGGGVGVLCSFAVPLLALAMPWAVSNAVITAASTLLCTELHARYTFAQGCGAGWREHGQSAGSAVAAYLATSMAVYVLHLVQPSPGLLTEQIVYLGASGLAGTARFAVLRLYVFAARRGRTTRRPLTRQGSVAAPVLAA
ncbi:hypothetical protein [Streptomyces sp. NBC_00444]|uniref:hypothetical protein n=1 Tax=Streptomyces sp. NBC_00444 TaxID=2975744 RepID=UPI002E23BBA3